MYKKVLGQRGVCLDRIYANIAFAYNGSRLATVNQYQAQMALISCWPAQPVQLIPLRLDNQSETSS